ncbi:YccF domain-containing protein [Halioxenophilus sp. WMMB6]|uniref:YccF domain-containing protein n=1 Tax=Halioxenophilus sp. WMMB6 TaxID=3073815 RepID=UPI00295F1EF5|nr:YccF domain-containing protein [Halioxenophilus sp. WMMB6]
MRTLGNILWHIPFLGFVNALLVLLLGLLLILTVVAAPIGFGLVEFGKFLLWPFGNTMVSQRELDDDLNPVWQAYSTLIMILYFPIGLLLTIFAIIEAVGLICSIIGIPVALVIIKSLSTYLNPVNKICVPAEVAEELQYRKAREYINRR